MRNNFAELEKPTMTNPIIHELIAREQSKDRFRQAEQRRLAKAVVVRQPTYRFDLRTSLGYLLNAILSLFKPLARTNKQHYDATHHASRPYSANARWSGRGLQNTCPVKVTRPKHKR
jgi:hypothetical protein